MTPIKRRSPFGVWLLTLITFGIYGVVWYYLINRELADANPDHRSSPGMSVLAITLGVFLIVPPFVSFYQTGHRIWLAQQRAGLTPTISPGLGVLASLLLALNFPYHQAELNRITEPLGLVRATTN